MLVVSLVCVFFQVFSLPLKLRVGVNSLTVFHVLLSSYWMGLLY